MNGSPLDARQNPEVYGILGYFIIAIVILIGIWILHKLMEKHRKSQAYIDAQKEKPCKFNHVTDLAKKINLSKEEVLLLWKICRITSAKNIFYNYTDEDYVETIFKTAYKKLVEKNADVNELYNLFRLRFHIDKEVSFTRFISSSTNIPEGTVLSYPAASGFQYPFTLVKNDKNGLHLSIPDSLEETSEDRPKELSKMAFIFNLANKQQYAIVTRVVQYLTLPNDEKELLVTHATTICPQSRRNSKRFSVNRDCKFSAVEFVENGKGPAEMKPKENKYDGYIVDLSEGGCKMLTSLPLKQKQYIYLRFEIQGKTEGVFGHIADTKTNMDAGMFAVHIGFKQTDTAFKTRLLADLYEYAD